MSKVVLKLEFSDAAADSGLFAAMIADFERNRETDANGKDVEKTSFHPGDIYHFLVQHDPGLRIADVRSSWGSVQSLGAATRKHEGEDIQLAEAEDEIETSYIPSGSVSATWYGNSPAIANTGRKINIVGADRDPPLPAIGKLSYSASWRGYRLVPEELELAEDEEWPVLIVAYLDVVE